MNLNGLQGNPWMLQSTLAIKLPVGGATAVPHEHGMQRSQRFLVHPLQSFVADACDAWYPKRNPREYVRLVGMAGAVRLPSENIWFNVRLNS